MTRGFSINIGINELMANHYGSSFKKLNSCRLDAENMADLAESNILHPKFDVVEEILQKKHPTAENVIKAIAFFAPKSDENPNPNPIQTPLQSGDILLVTFSGHGSRVPDLNSNGTPANEELSNYDQTWCLYDRQIIDDELAQLWSLFDEGVRILVISDSCHSGTIVSIPSDDVLTLTGDRNFKTTTNWLISFIRKVSNLFSSKSSEYKEGNPKTLFEPNSICENRFDESYKPVIERLERLLKAKKSKSGNPNAKGFKDFVNASVISITACQDDEKAKDGESDQYNGIFTSALKAVWYGEKSDNYLEFYKRVVEETLRRNPDQHPNLRTIPEKPEDEKWTTFLAKPQNKYLKEFMEKKPFEI